MKSNQKLIALGMILILSILAFPVRQTLLAKTEEATTAYNQGSNTMPSSEPPIITSSPPQSSEPLPSVSSSMKEEGSSLPVQESSTVPSTESTAISESSVLVSSIEETQETTPTSQVAVSTTLAPTSVIQPPATKQEVEANYNFSVVKNQTTQEFIDSIGADAQTIAWKEELYASVMIAQAILETGSGNSQLARPPYHNLFGIKGSYQGKQVNFATQEDNGSGQLYTIQSGFRQYPSYRESLEDYAALLKNGISGNTNFYQGVWKEIAKTYQEATKALTGKYATDTQYDKKLNALIETYQLADYDNDPANSTKTKQTSRSVEKSKTTDKSEEKTKETTSSMSEVLRGETSQGVAELLPIPQRPAKQVPGYLKTQ